MVGPSSFVRRKWIETLGVRPKEVEDKVFLREKEVD